MDSPNANDNEEDPVAHLHKTPKKQLMLGYCAVLIYCLLAPVNGELVQMTDDHFSFPLNIRFTNNFLEYHIFLNPFIL